MPISVNEPGSPNQQPVPPVTDQPADAAKLSIELDREEDGRWIAEVLELPGVLVYGSTREEAVSRVKVLALRVLADQLEHGEPAVATESIFSVGA